MEDENVTTEVLQPEGTEQIQGTIETPATPPVSTKESELEQQLHDLRDSYQCLLRCKNDYKALAAQGIAEVQYFRNTHGTEYAIRRATEISQAFGAIKDVN